MPVARSSVLPKCWASVLVGIPGRSGVDLGNRRRVKGPKRLRGDPQRYAIEAAGASRKVSEEALAEDRSAELVIVAPLFGWKVWEPALGKQLEGGSSYSHLRQLDELNRSGGQGRQGERPPARSGRCAGR